MPSIGGGIPGAIYQAPPTNDPVLGGGVPGSIGTPAGGNLAPGPTQGGPGAGTGYDTLTAYYNAQNNQGTTQNQNLASQLNQYTQGQQGLQAQLPGLYSALLGGQVPTQFTEPQSVINAYNQNFQNAVAPGIAAQFGAGSPQIAGQQSYGLQQLLAGLYQQGLGNYNNALAASSNFALNPIGLQGAQNNQGQFSNSGNQYGTQATTIQPSLLSQLLGFIGGTIT